MADVDKLKTDLYGRPSKRLIITICTAILTYPSIRQREQGQKWILAGCLLVAKIYTVQGKLLTGFIPLWDAKT